MNLRRFLLLAAALAVGLLAKRAPGERRTNLEAIDDPEVARDYLRIAETPQFALIRWLVARKAVGDGFAGRAIDVGGGPGKLAVRLARMAPQAEVVSLDLSPEMVDLANQAAAEAGLSDRVKGVLGSAESIPFPDDSFELVVSTLSLHHWEQPVAAFREIDRVLKPGGRALIVDFRRDMALLPWLFVNFVQRVIPLPALRRAGGPTGSVKAGYTPDEVSALLELAGMSEWQVTGGPAWVMIDKNLDL